MLETIETRWGMGVARIFDTPEARKRRPDPSVWPAFLHPELALAHVFEPPLGYAAGPTVAARVNHGVWQACCPFCPSAQHASLEDPWFYCARCHNESAGRLMLPVALPSDAAAIDELLSARPNEANRNWEPWETVADLAAENASMLGSARLVD